MVFQNRLSGVHFRPIVSSTPWLLLCYVADSEVMMDSVRSIKNCFNCISAMVAAGFVVLGLASVAHGQDLGTIDQRINEVRGLQQLACPGAGPRAAQYKDDLKAAVGELRDQLN